MPETPINQKLRDATGYIALHAWCLNFSKDEPILRLDIAMKQTILEEPEARKLFDMIADHFGFKTQ